MAQRKWLVQVVVRSSEAEIEAVADRIGEAICQPADHDGPCHTPWSMVRVPVDDLDEPERSRWGLLLDS